MEQLYGKAEDFFKDQMAEAWSQYRHVQTMRLQFLAMLFAVLSAGIGFIVNLCTSRDRVTGPALLFSVGVIIAVLFCLCSIIYVVLVRLHLTLDYYATVLALTRRYFLGEENYASLTWNDEVLDFQSKRPRLFGTQRSLRILVEFFMLMLLFAQVVTLVLMEEQVGLGTWRFVGLAFVVLLMFAANGVLFRGARKERQAHLYQRDRAVAGRLMGLLEKAE